MAENLEHDLAHDILKERRRERLWRNIRGFIWMAIVLLYAFLVFGLDRGHAPITKPYVAAVRLSGPIMPNQTFSARRAIPAITEAFKDHSAKGVLLIINSPGGSAAQASIIYDRLMELKKKYKKKLVVVGEDALASGGYLVASAADKIYVNRDTLTGSIGVVLSSFGFVDAMQKLGVTRRIFTAGTNKDRLDPFTKLAQTDVEKIDSVLKIVHQGFVNDVTDGRGNRLQGNKQELFSGDFWTGQQAVKLGLVDGLGNIWSVMQKEFGVEHFRSYSPVHSVLGDLFKGLGASLHVGLTQKPTPLREQAY